jgi:hypothetical protein
MIQEENHSERQSHPLIKSRCAFILLVIATGSLIASAWLLQQATKSQLPIPPPLAFVALGIAILALVPHCRRT